MEVGGWQRDMDEPELALELELEPELEPELELEGEKGRLVSTVVHQP